MEKHTQAQLSEQAMHRYSEAKSAYLSGDLKGSVQLLESWWHLCSLLALGQKLPRPEAPKEPSFYFGSEDQGPNDPDSPSPVPRKPYPNSGSGQAANNKESSAVFE